MLSALVKLNDLEHKFIRQQSQLEDKSEQIQEVQNRLEIQEKKHAERFKNLEEQYKNDIDKIKAEHAEDMRNMVKKIKNDHDEDMRNIEKIKTDHDEDMRKMEKSTEEIKMLRKSLSTKQPITPVVGFHVAMSNAWSGSGKVPFDKIISNYGHGWNSIIHTFKVPIKGLYFLILTVMNAGSSSAESWLNRGSTRVALAHAHGGHSYNVGTVSTVLLLDAGEHVYAQHAYGTLHSGSQYHYTYLAGFLIRKFD